jgi:hypothetical protein
MIKEDEFERQRSTSIQQQLWPASQLSLLLEPFIPRAVCPQPLLLLATTTPSTETCIKVGGSIRSAVGRL